MPTGALDAVIESQVMTLADGGKNETGNLIFKVATNVYLLGYIGNTALGDTDDLRFATFAIDDVTGDVTGTPIAELSIEGLWTDDDNFLDRVIQLPGTRIFMMGTLSVGTLAVRTYTCDADGTNLTNVDTQGFTGFSTTTTPFFHYLSPNVVAVAGALGGSNTRLITISVSDSGVISATPIQGPTAIAVSSVLGLTQVRGDTGVVVNSTGGGTTVHTFELNTDGTFNTTVIDSALIWSRSVGASQLHAIDKDSGIIEWSGWSQNATNRIERFHRITVDASGNITESADSETQTSAINHYRPTTFAIGNGVYLWLTEGSAIIRTESTLGLGVGDTLTVPALTSTKGVAFVLISPTMAAMAHIGDSVLGVIQYVTTFGLASPGASSTLVTFGSLEIDNYRPRFGGTPINLTFELHIQRWQESIETKALVSPTGQFKVVTLALNMIDMTIDVAGVIWAKHPAHPVVTEVTHIPDFIDLEEAAILWNKNAPETRVRLTLRLVSGARQYEGVISKLILIDNPGSTKVDFRLTMKIAWNQSLPTLREWN